MKDRLPKLSLPVRLVLLVAGTTLPLIIFAGANRGPDSGGLILAKRLYPHMIKRRAKYGANP